jgi:hypothetical protein
MLLKRSISASTRIGTASYAELAYQELLLDGKYVKKTTRERLMMAALEMRREGKVCL